MRWRIPTISNPERFAFRLGSHSIWDPTALVFDLQDELIGLLSKTYRRRFTAGVAVNVDQTLLNDAEKVRLHIPAQARNLLRHHQVHFNATAFGEPIDIPLQSGDQAGLIEHGWVQQVGERANLLQSLLAQGLGFGQAVFEVCRSSFLAKDPRLMVMANRFCAVTSCSWRAMRRRSSSCRLSSCADSCSNSFCPFAFGDVTSRTLYFHDTPTRVANHSVDPMLPPNGAVCIDNLVLMLACLRTRAVDNRLNVLNHSGVELRWNELQELSADQLLARSSEMPGSSIRLDKGQRGVGKVAANQFRLGLHHVAISFLAFAQGIFRQFAVNLRFDALRDVHGRTDVTTERRRPA